MKRVKSLTAFILSCAILPALISCKGEETASLPDFSHTEESEDATLPELDSSSEEDSSATDKPNEENPPSEKPSAPETPTQKPVTPVQPSTPKKAQYIRLTGDRVNLRKGAGTNYTVITSANQGTVYALTEKNGNWYKTFYRGQAVYVHTSYAAVFTLEKGKNEAVEQVIEEGYKLLGTPYVYGAIRVHDGKGKLLAGFSAQKFDCSSLIQYVFYKGANKLLNVNTRTQVKQGKYVHPNDLQRGDCIFFTNEDRQYNSGIERVGHVALYLGDNYILHTASDYACIEKISAKRWSFYIEARRFL